MSEVKTAEVKVCVLTTEAFDNHEATICPNYAEAESLLYQWCRDIWESEQEDWELGDAPDNDAEMYEQFREAAQDHDVQWQIFDNVTFDLALTKKH
jgi:hypothetical protein